ncbi:MAG: extracellular solute-binding protein [Anaerolineaceae bacterium]|nr:extracellular solute-binding protein [Anaerolineaceae bacterium]
MYRKFVPLMLLVGLLLPAMAVSADGHACDIAAPESSTSVNAIGWTYPIIDFYFGELEGCNEVDNLEVSTQLLDSGTANSQIELALASGSGQYGIVMTTQASVNSYVDVGWLHPLSDLIEKYQDEYDVADVGGLADMTVDGVIYGIPMERNTRLLFYRPDLLEKHGIEVPQTWDDIIAACHVLQDEESILLPFTVNLHAGWAWRLEFTELMLGLGGKEINEDGTPAFNSEIGVQALEKLVEIVNACMGEEGLNYSIDDSQTGIATGDIAIVHTWASRAAAMDDPDFSDYVGQIEFAPAPSSYEGGPYAVTGGTGAGLSIPAVSDVDPEVAFLVIMEALDLGSQVEAAKLGVVSRTAVAEVADARYLPAVDATINGGVTGSQEPVVSVVYTAIMAQWLPQIMGGEMSAQELLDAAAEAYTEEATAQGFIGG